MNEQLIDLGFPNGELVPGNARNGNFPLYVCRPVPNLTCVYIDNPLEGLLVAALRNFSPDLVGTGHRDYNHSKIEPSRKVSGALEATCLINHFITTYGEKTND